MKTTYLKAARQDLREAARYYEAQQPGLGGRFREEVRSAIRRIEEFPEAWTRLDDDVRRSRTNGSHSESFTRCARRAS